MSDIFDEAQRLKIAEVSRQSGINDNKKEIQQLTIAIKLLNDRLDIWAMIFKIALGTSTVGGIGIILRAMGVV